MNRLGLITQKLYHNYDIRAQTKKILQMRFEYFIFLFRSYSFGIQTINTFILMSAPVVSSKLISDSSVIKKIQKPYTSVRHIPYMAYIREYPLPGS